MSYNRSIKFFSFVRRRFPAVISSVFVAGLACVAVSCTEDLIEPTGGMVDASGSSLESFAAAKIINSSEGIYTNELMFKISDSVNNDLGDSEDQSGREVSTKSVSVSGDQSVSVGSRGYTLLSEEDRSTILGIPGVLSCEKLFPSVPGKEEMERRFGLDKWYLLTLSDGSDVKGVAMSVAKMSSTAAVEYCKIKKKNFDGNSFPFNPGPLTFEGAKASTKAPSASWCPFNDPNVGSQWHYYNTGDVSIAPTARAGADVNVKDAWRLTQGDPSIIVAVIDEGVYYDHPDLAANMWTNTGEIPGNGIDDDGNGYVDDVHGYNFAYGGAISCLKEDDGHGTHIAGTIAAVNNNGIGVCGLAGGNGTTGGVKIMSCQVFDCRVERSSGFARAFKYAADNGASIVQCSYGYNAGDFTSDAAFAAKQQAEIAAMDYFLATSNCPEALDGSVAIYAAGNDGAAMACYPGAYYKYICVGSIASDNLPAFYTNYGPGVNISAPGGEYYTGGISAREAAVLSTMTLERSDNTGYGYMQGTSMACPHVTGVAALGLSYMLKRGIHLSNNEFMSKLLTSVNDIDDLLTGEKTTLVGKAFGKVVLSPYRKNMGTGTIDAWRFLMQLDGIPSITAVVGQSQRLDISEYFGGCSKNLTYLSVDISDEDMEAIGLTEKPSMTYGRLKITPTKPGCARIHIKAIAGGDTLGDGKNMGGIELNRTVSIVARSVKSGNGGWL